MASVSSKCWNGASPGRVRVGRVRKVVLFAMDGVTDASGVVYTSVELSRPRYLPEDGRLQRVRP